MSNNRVHALHAVDILTALVTGSGAGRHLATNHVRALVRAGVRPSDLLIGMTYLARDLLAMYCRATRTSPAEVLERVGRGYAR
jgi:hypothetical protein